MLLVLNKRFANWVTEVITSNWKNTLSTRSETKRWKVVQLIGQLLLTLFTKVLVVKHSRSFLISAKIPLKRTFPQSIGAFIRFVMGYFCLNRSTLNFWRICAYSAPVFYPEEEYVFCKKWIRTVDWETRSVYPQVLQEPNDTWCYLQHRAYTWCLSARDVVRVFRKIQHRDAHVLVLDVRGFCAFCIGKILCDSTYQNVAYGQGDFAQTSGWNHR